MHLFCFKGPINDLPRKISQRITSAGRPEVCGCFSPFGQRIQVCPISLESTVAIQENLHQGGFQGHFPSHVHSHTNRSGHKLLNSHEWENPQKRSSNQQSLETPRAQPQRREGLGSFLPWVGVGFMLGFRLACRPRVIKNRTVNSSSALFCASNSLFTAHPHPAEQLTCSGLLRQHSLIPEITKIIFQV